ncbi:apolipoprotein N-acyltransferase [Rhizobium sp. RU36D]|uniref:apolipoprotein N-acyltransferase n=1 Tax=Rhizobium sp. RU36D TaxID=1907415 RepID=UPI0009D9099E|nr:apolipoprotein N-acyltransferase [Rhizobium sp. RU36D]SMD04470.1 Apolipoprotein N-acyltransferase [Rhizobium sp. RU36D]
MEGLAGRIMLTWGLRRFLLTWLAGAVAALGMPPIGFFAAMFLSFTLLVWLLDGATGGPESGFFGTLRSAFVIGWTFGFGYFVAGLWWLGNALMVEADEFAWALPLAILGLPAVLAVFYGLATLLARVLWTDGLGRIVALAAGFGLAEWLRSVAATGFPWNAIGYGAMPIPVMMQSAHAIGVFGVSALAVFVFATPALIATGKGMRRGIFLAVIATAAHFGYGAYRLQLPEPDEADLKTVRLVQPVIDQAVKLENDDREAVFAEHLRLSQLPPEDGGKRPDLIVWPETSIPFILTENPDALTRIADILEPGQVLLTGAVRSEDQGPGNPPRYYNSVYLIDDQGQILAASDKVHLTPFGEYVPYEALLRRLGVNNLVSLPGGFSAAAARSTLKLPDGPELYPLICYEIIFPDEMDVQLERAGAILNITNDAWFGNTPGPYQHFLQARLRAVENEVPVIRSANSGISATIDTRGRIISGVGFNVKAIQDSTVNFKTVPDRNITFAQRNFWLLLAALSAFALISRLGFIFRKN